MGNDRSLRALAALLRGRSRLRLMLAALEPGLAICVAMLVFYLVTAVFTTVGAFHSR